MGEIATSKLSKFACLSIRFWSVMKQYFSKLRQQLTFDKIMQITNVKNMRKIWDVNLAFKFDNCVLQINLPWNISLFFSCHFSNYLVISKLVYRAKIAFRGYTFKNARTKGNTTIMNGCRKIKSKQPREVQNMKNVKAKRMILALLTCWRLISTIFFHYRILLCRIISSCYPLLSAWILISNQEIIFT